MKKLAFLLVLLVGCASHQPAVLQLPSQSSSVDARFDSVAALVVERDGEYVPYCSGVFVKQYLVTAAHCVASDDGEIDSTVQVAMHRDFDDTEARFTQAWKFFPVLVWEDRDVSVLAPILASSRHAHGSVRVAREDLVRGEDVEVYGHPRRYLYYFARGQVVTPYRLLGDRPFTLINAAGYPGMSGGPAFNRSGELVGLVSFGWYGQSHIQGIVTRDSVFRAVNQVMNN